MPFASALNVPQHAVGRLFRAYSIAGEQVAAVRKRWLIDSLRLGAQINALPQQVPRLDTSALLRRLPAIQGALWQINTRLDSFRTLSPATQGYGKDLLDLFSAFRTDLNAFSPGECGCLENHGYSLADAAIRTHAPHLCLNPTTEFAWPHQEWQSDEKAKRTIQASGQRNAFRDVRQFFFSSWRPRQ